MTAPAALHPPATVATILGKTENWVKRNAHRLPHHRFGHTIAFTDDDVATIIRDAQRGPHTTPDTSSDNTAALRPSTAKRRAP